MNFLLAAACVLAASAQKHNTDPASCPNQCPPGSFHNKAGECSTQVNLHEACSSKTSCEPAYSACIAGKCTCLPGFKELSMHCYPASYTCPGQAPMAKAQKCIVDVDECSTIQGKAPTGHEAPYFGQRCLRPLSSLPVPEMASVKINEPSLGRFKRHVETKAGFQFNGGCPADSVCTITQGFMVNKCHAYGVGHCCKHSCPLGEPHPSASCAKGAYGACGQIPGYSCHRGYMTPGAVEAFGELIDEFFPATCCPNHCPPGTTTSEVGHCYPEAGGLDNGCWRDEQCFDRKCIAGQCQCEPGTQRVVFPSGAEACVNATSNKALGEDCDQASGDVCGPENSKCFDGKCCCNCGYTSVGDTRCLRAAQGCPRQDAMYSCGLWASQGDMIVGECKKNPNWMIKNCPFACGLCGLQYG